MTDRKAKQRRLERAGYVYISGWVPLTAWFETSSEIDPVVVQNWIDGYLPRVEAIVDEPAKPRGRPKLAPALKPT